MSMKRRAVLVALLMLLGSAVRSTQGRARGPPAAAQEEAQPQLPAAVATAISSAFPGATVSESEQDTDDGISVYYVVLSTGAEVEVTADGTVIVADYTIDMSKVPAAAAKSIQTAAAGATIKEVLREEIYAEIEGGKAVKLAKPVTEYLATLNKGGQEGEISVRRWDGRVRWSGGPQ
jgi:hypothetical protein